MILDEADKMYLKDLAKSVLELSGVPDWDIKIRLWQEKNSLKHTRPLILCMPPEEVWPELIPASRLKIEDPFWRQIEWDLLKRIYRYDNIKDDYIIDNKLYVPIRYTVTDWFQNRRRPYAGDGKKAEKFYPCIKNYDDLKFLKKPMIVDIDKEGTAKSVECMQDVFDGILDIIAGEPFYAGTDGEVKGWGVSAIDILCELRGLENVFYDMVENPCFVHDAMNFISDGLIDYLMQMEAYELLFLNHNTFCKNSNTPLGSNGLACLGNLIQNKTNHRKGLLNDLWGYLMSQEFALVSPEMTDEFVYQYQQRIAKHFGLICYGCCEPNDKKWELIKARFNNLRVVSVSHASDLEIAAEKISHNYVFSWKPHSMLIEPFDENNLRKVLSNAFKVTKACHMVCSMRDNLTFFGQPERAGKWINIAMEVALNS